MPLIKWTTRQPRTEARPETAIRNPFLAPETAIRNPFLAPETAIRNP